MATVILWHRDDISYGQNKLKIMNLTFQGLRVSGFQLGINSLKLIKGSNYQTIFVIVGDKKNR